MKTVTRKQQKQKKAELPAGGAAASLRQVHWTFWILLSVIVLFAVLRFRLRDAPLERDEGEYAYSGQLMLQGIPPYRLAYNMKLPGTYAAYGIIMAIFGGTSTGIHTGLLLMNAGTSLLVFALGRKIFGAVAGTFAGASYAILSAEPVMLGLAGHATHFVVCAAVAGILVLLHALDSPRGWLFFASGTLLGIAFLMKQPGIVFALFAIVLLAHHWWSRSESREGFVRRLLLLTSGIAWPFAATCLILYAGGVFPSFWFWTFTYARAYASRVPFGDGLLILRSTVADILFQNPAIWLICLGGVFVLFRSRVRKSGRFFLASLFLFSFLGVSAGLSFRPHYFILLLPAASLLAGLCVAAAIEHLENLELGTAAALVPVVVFVLICGFSLRRNQRFFFAANAATFCQRMYPGNPFLEAQAISQYLRSQMPEDARLAVFGSEPEIYFDAQRKSATGYIYTYGLMEDQPYALRMQQEMIREVTEARPEYLVFVDNEFSWLWQAGPSRQGFFEWLQSYINSGYEKAAEVRIAGSSDHLLSDAPKIYVYRLRH
jgi:dolichyl-phosphate-mannose-protein mannosyltransferase